MGEHVGQATKKSYGFGTEGLGRNSRESRRSCSLKKRPVRNRRATRGTAGKRMGLPFKWGREKQPEENQLCGKKKENGLEATYQLKPTFKA